MPEEPTTEALDESEIEPTNDDDFQDLDEALSGAEEEIGGELDEEEEDEDSEEAVLFDLDQYGDELVSITVDGEEQQVPLAELRNGYMREASFTKKSQALAADRNAAEQYKALDEAFAADPQKTLDQLAVAYGLQPLSAAPKAQVDDDGYEVDLDPTEQKIAELEAQIQDLMGNQEAQSVAAQQAALDAEFEGIKRENDDPDLDFAELINFAVDNSIGDMKIAYEVMSSRKAATNGVSAGLGQTKTKSKNRKAAKRSAPPVEGGASRRGSGPAVGAMPSLDEALAAAEQETGIRL